MTTPTTLPLEQLQAADEITAAYRTLKRLSDRLSDEEPKTAALLFGAAAGCLFEHINFAAHGGGSLTAKIIIERILEK